MPLMAEEHRPEAGPTEESDPELRERLALLTPADTVRGLFLNGVLEVVRKLGSDDLVRQCLEASGEQRFVEFFTYSSAVHLRVIYRAARLLGERYGGFDKALWQMGHEGAVGYFSSALGKTLLLLGRGDPRKLVSALPQAFSLSSAALQSTLEWTGPKSALFLLKRDIIPTAYTEGVLHGLLEQAVVKRFHVSSRKPSPLSGEYSLSWE